MKTEDKKPAPRKTVPGKVFDVSRPGKAAASPTSRPVIMGHKPEAQAAQTSVSGIGEASPLLTKRKIQVLPAGGAPEEQAPAAAELPQEDLPAGAPAANPTETEEAALGTAAVDAASGPPALPPEKAGEPQAEPEAAPSEKPKLVITPPSQTEAREAAAEAPEPEAPAEAPATEPEAATAAPAEATRSERPAASTGILSDTSSSVPETETAAEPPAPADPLKPAEEPSYPKLDPLFDDAGHIVVSHHNHRQRHTMKVLALLLLIVLLAAVAFDLLLDLGLLQLEGLPRTNFFPGN